jgi:hypothetical protein
VSHPATCSSIFMAAFRMAYWARQKPTRLVLGTAPAS